tara:strand:+ start:354 stop:506 length:153 start_codon:yes stop_codon:yes gene_type:complete
MIRIYINGASGKMGQSLSKLIESDDQFQSVSENDFLYQMLLLISQTLFQH